LTTKPSVLFSQKVPNGLLLAAKEAKLLGLLKRHGKNK
jgi:hypothetical protein